MSKESYVNSGTVSAGNSIYTVHVQDNPLLGIGLYTATTGPSHPIGPGRNILFGNGNPGTSYNTIRSYTSGTDYIQSNTSPSSTFNLVHLTGFGTITPIGTTGFLTTYVLPGPPVTPDKLTILSSVNVGGTTFADSSIGVSTWVMNSGTDTIRIGIRYLWDFLIGSDDGPTFQGIDPNSGVFVNEVQFFIPRFQSFRMEDNDINPNPPTYDGIGSVNGPTQIVPPPLIPLLLQYVSWPNAFNTAFNYTINPNLNIADAGRGPNDSAVNYTFGPDIESSILILPGSGRGVSETLKASLPIASRGIAF